MHHFGNDVKLLAATDLSARSDRAGTHGRTGFRHAVLVSIAEDLISTLPVDVLAVRPPREKQ